MAWADPAVQAWVADSLTPLTTAAHALRATLQRPDLQPGQIAIRGRVDYTRRAYEPETRKPTNILVHIRYGLERFYVAEGTGNARGRLTVDVAVSPNGRPLLKQLYLDGRPVEVEVARLASVPDVLSAPDVDCDNALTPNAWDSCC